MTDKPKQRKSFDQILAEYSGKQLRQKPRHEEENIQISCVKWFRYQYPDKLLVHCPNGGARSAREGAIFKAAGVVAGFPDLFLYEAHGGYHGLAIEMKTETGRQSKEQKMIEEKLVSLGYKYVVVRNFDNFQKLVSCYIGSDQ